MRTRTVWLASAALFGLSLDSGSQAAPPAVAPAAPVRAQAPVPAAPVRGMAAAPAASDPFALTAERYTLPSGMTVLLRRDPAVPRVVVSLWFAVGSRDEAPGRTGFAHLYEHLMFMGTRNVPDNRFDAIMESEGGGNNATTNTDRTFYFDFGPSHLLPTLLWLEAERLTNLPETMTDEKVALQREVVRNERRQSYENRPYGMAELRLPQAMYPAGHPYSWPVIGSHEDLIAASTTDVKQFFYKYYTPSNATLAIVGDFNPEEAKRLINTYFGWMPKRPKPVAPSLQGGVPEMVVPVEQKITVEDQVALPRVYVVWHAPPVQSPDYPETVLLGDMLGKGRASRLHRKLVVEKKLAQAVEVEVDPQQLGSTMALQVTAQQGVTAEQLSAALEAELGAFAAAPPSAEEILRARNLRLTELARDVETPLGQSLWIQQLNAWLGDPNSLPQIVAKLRSATPQSVQKRAQDLGVGDVGRRLQIVVVPGKAQVTQAAPTESKPKLPPIPTGKPKVAQPVLAPMRAPFDLSKPPKPLLVRTPTPPPSAQFRVHGVEVTLVQRKGTPLIETAIAIPVGEADAVAAKSGLADAVAAMLSEGSGQRSGTSWAEAMQAAGATWKAQVQSDTTLLTMGVLGQTYAEAAPLFYEAILRPRFEEKEWTRVRGERLASLEQKKDEPAQVAERVLRSSLFGATEPYGRWPQGSAATLQKLTATDLRAFHQSFYPPRSWKIVVAGDFEPSQAQADKLLGVLGRLPLAPPASPMARPTRTPPRPQRGLVLVDRPGAPQAEVRVANLVPGALDPERPIVDVVNVLLGGMFTSRLNQNLREKHGYTYGARSAVMRSDGLGYWVAQAAVRSDVTTESVVELRAEERRLRDELCSAEELVRSRNGAIQRLVMQSERTSGLSQLYAGFARNRLPTDEFARLLQGAQLATPAKLQEVSRARLRPDEATIVIVGDVAKLMPKLPQALGITEVQLRDAEGNPLPAKAPK